MKTKVALIAPEGKNDYLLNNCLDGLFELQKTNPDLVFKISPNFVHSLPKDLVQAIELSRGEFIKFAREADLVVLAQRKDGTNFKLAEEVGAWSKTVFLDGSELGRDRRFDSAIQKKVLEGSYSGNGRIDKEMLAKCAHYFRREKPYPKGVTPFPYSIETSYAKHFDPNKKKDLDFVCIFGQDEYPIMRRHTVEVLEDFCKKESFSCRTKQTKDFDFSAEHVAGREEFYDLLARAKVGISIGGGGYDTVRFWETLANNCLLLTEKIDIYEPGSEALNFKRIYEFSNLYDFQFQLEKLGRLLRSDYENLDLMPEYKQILERHSSIARVSQLLEVLNRV